MTSMEAVLTLLTNIAACSTGPKLALAVKRDFPWRMERVWLPTLEYSIACAWRGQFAKFVIRGITWRIMSASPLRVSAYAKEAGHRHRRIVCCVRRALSCWTTEPASHPSPNSVDVPSWADTDPIIAPSVMKGTTWMSTQIAKRKRKCWTSTTNSTSKDMTCIIMKECPKLKQFLTFLFLKDLGCLCIDSE